MYQTEILGLQQARKENLEVSIAFILHNDMRFHMISFLSILTTGGTFFNATRSVVSFSIALKTTPNVPVPTTLSISKLFSVRSRRYCGPSRFRLFAAEVVSDIIISVNNATEMYANDVSCALAGATVSVIYSKTMND